MSSQTEHKVADVTADTVLPNLSFAAMQGLILHEAEEHGLPIKEQTESRLLIQTEFGVFGIENQDDGLRLMIKAPDADSLHIVRDGLVEHLIHYMPDLQETMRWSDNILADQFPPNFQFAEVIEVRAISTDFHRVILRPERLMHFGDSAIHFRFVLPPKGCAEPVWPTLSPSGATVWPKGEHELHRPVYTVREQSNDKGTLSVDIFMHEGGRMTPWAKTIKAEDRVAIIGPGGGGTLDVDQLVICGDETAFPAIARILATLPDHAWARVMLYSSSGATDYPIPEHPNFALQWVGAESGLDFVDAAHDAVSQNPEAFVWFAAERLPTDMFRKLELIKNLPKSRKYIAQFWSNNG
ncbi:siderophore-interacting protein [Yoonia sp. BS5-3]|uniref:Siderophore-interacting protein n=1 Tax=Yoonia phaeophyticola TaxID=3137369 RepID=A0ABZ3IEL4_9RHOB